MLRKFSLPFLLFILCFVYSSLFANPKEEKELKVLVLIIASYDKPAYFELERIWKSYMNADKEHVEAYFIRGNPLLSKDYEINENEIIVKTEEGYKPGIIDKTILSMEAMRTRLKEFDYVIRTNLSSFYVLPRLLAFLEKLPRQGCYCGVPLYIPQGWNCPLGQVTFVSGAGIIFSRDVAEKLISEKEEIFKHHVEIPDDVLIGWVLQKNKIRVLPAPRVDFQDRETWLKQKDNIPSNAFHFRAKKSMGLREPSENFDEELYINKQLLKFFYPDIKERK